MNNTQPPKHSSTPRSSFSALLSAPSGPTPIPPSLQAKMAAMVNKASLVSPPASGTPAPQTALADPTPVPVHPTLHSASSFPLSSPTRVRRGGISGRRIKPGFTLRDIDPSAFPVPGSSGGALGAGLGAGRPSMLPDNNRRSSSARTATPFSNFSKIVDPSGILNFNGKAVLHASGVDFSNGSSFVISMDQFRLDEELGKGNYGTVKKVLHKPTNVAMAMKEIRLELDDAKLNAILMELDVLHRAVSPEIVEFYGAFFIESCVYYCMEYMDAGSMDKLQIAGVPEEILAKIAVSMVRGLKFLKDDLQIIHRDVKPTNVLVNKKGEIKLCDFGVSGQLEKSLAKTNIGCQSYMAPERIKGESQGHLGTYTVSSDVWSLGLSIIEIAIGHYPYPPETYSNVFAQLTAIVNGEPPELPEEGFSEIARDWVSRCLAREPARRPSYAELLSHPFLVQGARRKVHMSAWVQRALAYVSGQESGESDNQSP